MMRDRLETYEQFVETLNEAGFLPLSANPVGMPNVADLTAPNQWHTGLDTDPWQWKSRVVEEGRAAFGKVFAGRPAFIAPAWMPLLLAARRGGATVEERWEDGALSPGAVRIWELFAGGRERMAAHDIRRLAGFGGGSTTRFDVAMIELQMGMFLTVCGQTRKVTLDGRPHGWPVLEYAPVERWVWPDAWQQGLAMNRDEAIEALLAQLASLRPGLTRARALKFLLGE